MDTRLYPVTPAIFQQHIEPLIVGQYIWKGRPPKVSHYLVFCAILYVLRTGIPWRDLPPCYGYWHTIYLRFKRGSERGLWWRILIALQQKGIAQLNIVLADSTTWKVHRHGGGSKGGIARAAKTARA
ncbi:MAG: transposase [Patescibacteria group bacterium]|nr:transposase [Patescibacteria group bacterium]